MVLVEAVKGKCRVGDRLLTISEMTTGLATVFDLNQLFLEPLDGDIQTLWFNRSGYVIKEYVPSDIRHMVKKEYGIS